MSSGYAITSALTGLAASSFTWGSAYTTSRERLNDGEQDEQAAGSASATASPQTLIIDFGVPANLVGFAILEHNLATGGVTVKVEADTSGTFGTAVTAKADTTINTTAPYQKDTVLQFPSVGPNRYWRLTFTHSSTKRIRIGELLALTTITTLSRQTGYGTGEEARYVQNRIASDAGRVHATLLSGPILTRSLPFKDLRGTAERDELTGMWHATYGGVLNLLWIDLIESTATAASAAAQVCIWGKLQESLGWTEDDFNLFGISGLTLVGRGRTVL